MNECEKQQAIIEALDGVVSWYEVEMDRSNYDDSDVPDDLAELEQKLIAARNIPVSQ